MNYYTADRRTSGLAVILRPRGAGFVVQLLISSSAGLILLAIAHTAQDLSHPVAELSLVMVAVPVVMLALVLQSGLLGEQRSRAAAMAQPIPGALYAGLIGLFLVTDHRDLTLVLASLVFGWLCVSVLAVAVMRRGTHAASGGADLPDASQVRRFARRAAVSTAARQTNSLSTSCS